MCDPEERAESPHKDIFKVVGGYCLPYNGLERRSVNAHLVNVVRGTDWVGTTVVVQYGNMGPRMLLQTKLAPPLLSGLLAREIEAPAVLSTNAAEANVLRSEDMRNARPVPASTRRLHE